MLLLLRALMSDPTPTRPALRPAVCVTHLHLDIKLSPTRLCELKGWALHWPDWLCKAGMQLEHDLTRIDSPNNNRIVVYIQLVVFVLPCRDSRSYLVMLLKTLRSKQDASMVCMRCLLWC
jgi:hypothetical protein